MTLLPLLQHVIPVSLLAAVSPVLFLNSMRATQEGGKSAGLRFILGAAAVLAVLGLAMIGAVGASAATFVSTELASNSVDTVLAVILIGYGVWQLRPSAGGTAPQPGASTTNAPSATSTHGALFAGVIGMATNFTTLPLYLSVAQRTGVASIAFPLRALVLIACTAVVLAPTWLPLVLPRHSDIPIRLSARTRHRVALASRAISVGACLFGGALILWHAWGR